MCGCRPFAITGSSGAPSRSTNSARIRMMFSPDRPRPLVSLTVTKMPEPIALKRASSAARCPSVPWRTRVYLGSPFPFLSGMRLCVGSSAFLIVVERLECERRRLRIKAREKSCSLVFIDGHDRHFRRKKYPASGETARCPSTASSIWLRSKQTSAADSRPAADHSADRGM